MEHLKVLVENWPLLSERERQKIWRKIMIACLIRIWLDLPILDPIIIGG